MRAMCHYIEQILYIVHVHVHVQFSIIQLFQRDLAALRLHCNTIEVKYTASQLHIQGKDKLSGYK